MLTWCTFSDYHYEEPRVSGMNVKGVLITGSNWAGGHNVSHFYGPVAGIYYSEIFDTSGHDWISSRLSKN